MTGSTPRAAARAAVRAFPDITKPMQHAYQALWPKPDDKITEDEVKQLGTFDALPRPWDVTTCLDPQLRRDVWTWLEQVVDWINTECAWDVTGLIPGCWYLHPHLVHDLGALADQRRRASSALTSNDLAEWQRTSLPLFLSRMHSTIKATCDDTHKDPPGRARILASHTATSVGQRHAWFDREVAEGCADEAPAAATAPQPGGPPMRARS